VALLCDLQWEDGTRDEAETGRDLAWVFFARKEEPELSRTFDRSRPVRELRVDMSARVFAVGPKASD
jgi:hypothetical protein